MVSGDTENPVVRNAGGGYKVVNERLNKRILSFLTRKSQIASDKDKIKHHSFRYSPTNVVQQGRENSVL